MGTEHAYFSSHDGEITGHISYQTLDATFRLSGEKVNMYFHNYLGPSFFAVRGGVEVDIYPDEESEIWEQFEGWWRAKGRVLYP